MNMTVYLVVYAFAYILSIPVHEFGHLAFGLLTGFRFNSFSLFGLTWTLEDGAIKLGRTGNRFIIGQCLMRPPENEEDFSFTLYNLGGGLMNLIVGALSIVPIIAFDLGEAAFSSLLGIATANLAMGALNLIPMDKQLPNDGMNGKMAAKSPLAKHGIYQMLRINELTTQGMTFREIPEEFFAIDGIVDYTNYLEVYLLICQSARYYDIGDYEKSIAVYEGINLDRLQAYYSKSIKMDYLNYYCLHNLNPQIAMQIRNDPKMKKNLGMPNPSISRVLAAYEFYINNDRERAVQLLEKARRELDAYPNKAIKIMEGEYLENLRAKICGEI